jgi:hypothetical protein
LSTSTLEAAQAISLTPRHGFEPPLQSYGCITASTRSISRNPHRACYCTRDVRPLGGTAYAREASQARPGFVQAKSEMVMELCDAICWFQAAPPPCSEYDISFGLIRYG